MKRIAPLVVIAFCLLTTPAFGQATRTWVSGVGDDVNPCSRTAPCKTFSGAESKTFIGGEIDALDDAGYGTITINKSLTIDGGGHLASILASGTNGVNINIAPNANDPNRRVVLRNLGINGAGASGTVGTNTGLRGLNVIAGNEVDVENTRIFGFTQNAIFDGAPGHTALSLDNVTLAGNDGNALDLRPSGGGDLSALVRNSTIKETDANGPPNGDTGIGIRAADGAHVWLTGTSIFDNLIGLKAVGSGVFDSFCDNSIGGNGDDGTKPNPLCPQPASSTSQPTVVTQQVPVAAQCVVPNLRGLTLAFAKRLLGAANCRLGKVTKKRTHKRSQVGKVISQKPKAGTKLANGAKVAVVVGRR